MHFNECRVERILEPNQTVYSMSTQQSLEENWTFDSSILQFKT